MSRQTNQVIEKPIDRIRLPLERIIHLENLSGLALIAGAVTALVLANTGAAETMDHFWHSHLEVVVGPVHLDESLVHWVNDGLMTIFFFVAGLEIKRELVVGDLREPRKAALPAFAAFGGMVVPALFYVVLSGSETRHGWGIPMATDIAFAVGILTLLGNRVPSRLKVFLLTLAIVDDLGAILVIAVFYTTSLNTTALAVALGLLAAMVTLRVLGVWWMPVYVLVGFAMWLAVFESGVHATLAGVICGLLAPAKPRRPDLTEVVAHESTTIDELKSIVFDTRESRSVVDRLIHGLHPVTALFIVPVFALANTGVGVSPAALWAGLSSSTGLAVLIGLTVGKPLGIGAASWLAVRSGVAALPSRTGWNHIIGVGFLGGIGFTVSLFITELAFEGNATTVDHSKIAVLSASILASALGAALLVRAKSPIEDDSNGDLGPITFEELDATVPEAMIASTREHNVVN
ncbi:MAG: Na+/H+ antiporter NhaA [Acidimicrobiia bacterium]|nr:Na+/H+ antiporter NhaA [Acidimicrobiia bacterium]